MTNFISHALGALGVVYGDIGTSPLYAINELFFGHAEVARNISNVLGTMSLVFWSLTIIISIKYIIIVFKADNDGEGGVFALYGLLSKKRFVDRILIITLLIFAAGLLYGDGIITPAISVVSAVEGLKIVTSTFQPYIAIISIAILSGLFFIQNKGTYKIGRIFGPMIIIWFISIGFLGLAQIIQYPMILKAINPYFAFSFLFTHSIKENFLVMGAVMLVMTGGEAMYADMGHFGKKPIRVSWFILVYPSLLLSYFGQGAYLLSSGKVMEGNVFYSIVPHLFLIPMVVIATVATIIASQALISGAFSLTAQAIAFELLPRMTVKHTNDRHHGQIYISTVNWVLCIGTIILVLTFKSSTNLAGAYGLAVSGVMLITTMGMFFISQQYWKWSVLVSILLFVPLILFESTFFFANMLKLFQGGYVPLIIAIIIAGIMLIWKSGGKLENATYKDLSKLTLDKFIKIKQTMHTKFDRSSIFLTPLWVTKPEQNIPLSLETFWKRYHILPQNLVMLTVNVDQEYPFIHSNRYKVINFYKDAKKGSISSVKINFGFMEEPNVEGILEGLTKHHQIDLDINPKHWLIHVLHKRILLEKSASWLTRIRFKLFHFLDRNSMKADHYFGIGNETELTVEVVPIKFFS